MPRPTLLAPLSLVLLLAAGAAAAEEPVTVRHEIELRLLPDDHRLEAVDRITLPAGLEGVARDEKGRVRFRLHAGLEARVLGEGFVLEAVGLPGPRGGASGEMGAPVPLRTWALEAKGGQWPDPPTFTLALQGEIHHPLETEGQEYARSFSRTPGTIQAEGAVLSGASWWVPVFSDHLITFRLTVTLPEAWNAVSQGVRTRQEVAGGKRVVTWACIHPMDEVYVIAAPFTEYARPAGSALAQAFLRKPDPALAAKYLEATAQYLDMYARLIGPYPFEKFALVENFWETGYGMPSFTLLGPQVIRFPFILHSSYPHEILHNWWGNSVYVDWRTGNWCEGLTAYEADHLIREGQGRGTEYRRDTLKSYRNYVRGERDFPLTEFRSRHSSATQAVGYGKALMVFHMLRVRFGDEAFAQALRRFYRHNLWRAASWADVQKAFEEVTSEDLGAFFAQWIRRKGAPALEASLAQGADGRQVLEIRQVQEGETYDLLVPVALTRAGQDDAVYRPMRLTERSTRIPLDGEGGDVVRVDVDPEFDVFRRLDLAETPPTLSELFGAEAVTIVVPKEEATLAAGWRTFAETWRQGATEAIEVVAEDRIETLPSDRAVWVLGGSNRWGAEVLEAVAAHGAEVNDEQIRFGRISLPRTGHAFVLVARHPAREDAAIAWVGADRQDALAGLARKLPHYGKYSWLAFEGSAPDNVAKGEWPATGSPLTVLSRPEAEAPERGRLPVREPLARLKPVFDADRMLADVRWLADDEREGRGVGTEGLEAAATWLAQGFEAAGLKPGGDEGTFLHTWEEADGPGGRPVGLSNVIGVIPGTDPALEGQSVVVGAHYDHLGRGWPDVREGNAGKVHNGADDNASGVAVLLEVARLLAPEHRPRRTIVFVLFSGEEWGLKGSRRYVKTTTRWPAGKAIAMVNLDTVGRLGEQRLTLLGAGTASEWRHIAMGIGFTTGVESTPVADDPGGSDQVSFHEAGVPAVQLFTGPHEDYHRPTDDVERIDAAGLVKVATWLKEALLYLGDRPDPLTSSLGGAAPPSAPREGARRVSLGTMPDFQFAGPGVKVQAVLEGSPAAAAGIQPGDVVLAIDGEEVVDLRAYSRLLREKAAGDVIRVRLQRGAEAIEVEARLEAR